MDIVLLYGVFVLLFRKMLVVYLLVIVMIDFCLLYFVNMVFGVFVYRNYISDGIL